MSWLSTSLSENLTNITGQLSTFTKDILTEGTLEVDDHETELKITKARVRDLELTLYTQREEYDRLKELNHELQERTEAAELQITSISREYRVLLQEKEDEVVHLRHQLESAKELANKDDHAQHQPSFSEEQIFEGTSHEEVEYLKAIIKKLQDEKQQWNKNYDSENLHKEMDHYQQELATLHTTYSQRISSINKKHKLEIEELESFHQEDSLRIQELEQRLSELERHSQMAHDMELKNLPESESDLEIIMKESVESDQQALASGSSSSDHGELKLQIDRMECENKELKELLGVCQEKVKEKELLIYGLQQENSQLREHQYKHQKYVENTGEMKTGFEREHDDNNGLGTVVEVKSISGAYENNTDIPELLEHSNNDVMKGFNNDQQDSSISRLQEDIRNLKEQRDQAVSSKEKTSASLESLREELSRLGAVTMELMKELEQSQGVEKERSIEIESLKKLCQVRRLSEIERDTGEVMKLKEIITVLWRKYSSVIVENAKGETKLLLDNVNDVKTKLASQIEGQRLGVQMEKNKLISKVPEVESEVENREECLTRLLEQNDKNKLFTKEIVRDFGLRSSFDNYVSTLIAEKEVLERTIVGLEAKVEELEEIVKNLNESAPENGVPGVLCVDHSVDEGETGFVSHSSVDSIKDYEKLMEKIQEYEQTIEEFEFFRKDWEGEKEALENVVVELRQKLKDPTPVASTDHRELKEYFDNIEDLMVKRNYVGKDELCTNGGSGTRLRHDILLSRVVKLLQEKQLMELHKDDVSVDRKMIREDTIVQEKDSMYSEVGMDNGSIGVDEAHDVHEKPSLGAMKDNLTGLKNELAATKNELVKTKRRLDETNNELEVAKQKLSEGKTKFDALKQEFETAHVANKASSERECLDLKSKLEILKRELDLSRVNLNSTISEKDKEIHTLRDNVEQLQQVMSNFEHNKATAVAQLQQEIKDLHEDLNSVTTSCKNMTAQLEESKQQLISVEETRASLKEQLHKIGKEKTDLLAMVNDRDSRIEDLQDLHDTLDQQMSSLKEEGDKKSRSFVELSEENLLLKEEKSELFAALETKRTQLDNTLRDSANLTELLREQEMATNEMRRQNNELAKDLESWRIHIEELNRTKEALSRDLDAKSEEIMSLKESNIELSNQSYESNAEVTQKLSMLEQVISENMALKSENGNLMAILSETKHSEKELQDSYNSLMKEKEQLDASFFTKSVEMDREIRKKTDEVEVLRLEVARLTKESHDKDNVIRAQVSSNLVSGSDRDIAAKQEQLRHILKEKDEEIEALRSKNESLLALFSEGEQEKGRVNEENDSQHSVMLDKLERMSNEVNEKNNQIIALEDRVEMLNIKSASKDQASALMHSEQQKLLHLNQSQGEEIGRLREKIDNLRSVVGERNSNGESLHLSQRNAELQSQLDTLQAEQERLLILVHEKDKQLSVILNEGKKSNTLSSLIEEPLVRKENERFVNALFEESTNNLSNNELMYENSKLREELKTLQGSIEKDRNANSELISEKERMVERLKNLEVNLSQSKDDLRKVALEREQLRELLSSNEEENGKLNYELNTLRNEKDELYIEQTSIIEDLRKKLDVLLHIVVSDVDLGGEQFEILESREDFERLVTRIKTHRTRLRSDKENEIRLLKEQVQTLNSVQNISSPQLEAKLEQFMSEKELLSQKIAQMESERVQMLEMKEDEMTILQSQIVNLSDVLNQKERHYQTEKSELALRHNTVEQHANVLQRELDAAREGLSASKNEITRLCEEITRLSASADSKLDVTLREKDARVNNAEKEIRELNEKYSQSVQELQSTKSELDKARTLARNLEAKKEKELERLRTHLLQVEDSYTQEALEAQERENELCSRVESMQKQLLTSSNSLQDNNRNASIKFESLQEQLNSITTQRDEALAQLEQVQEQALQYARSVENLQMVLEQFQREKESELNNLRASYENKLTETQSEVIILREREQELQKLLHNASDALNKAEMLSNDLKAKEDQIENLKMTVVHLESDLQSSHDKLRQLASSNDGKIEKGIMKNMLLAYFNTTEHKRSDVVAVLGHILDFTDEEIKRVGTGSQPPQATGWFSGLLSMSSASRSQPQLDKTFSQLFVSFLEKESENQLSSKSHSSVSQQRSDIPKSSTVTAIPSRLRDSPLPISPLAASTPLGVPGNANTSKGDAINPLLLNERKEEKNVLRESRAVPNAGNALLGSSLRPSLDLPTFSNSSSSSTALRQILFNN
ncbi:thyroid receptor-interacting protein 11-like isoform X2 [Xenia sp. Carnegie-2017]|uniref:thyroid receptor-interacting protein 11-like isoform X2 n=1 Tax=Xenia sp. Carnegie-2017 TaxID=2897299 RepID=UPI001F040D71|nr:thyroid receptor-interacting protein 11-like isoform X2 [Xenia sp. Carnegie-2017]